MSDKPMKEEIPAPPPAPRRPTYRGHEIPQAVIDEANTGNVGTYESWRSLIDERLDYGPTVSPQEVVQGPAGFNIVAGGTIRLG